MIEPMAPAISVSLTVNGVRHERTVEPRLLLADFLRHELGLTGTHLGCEHGVCGACTVLIDGEPARSCLAYAVACDGLEVTTKGPEVEAGREAVLEYMLVNHPLDCPVCDKAGECKLQDYTYEHRHGLSRFKEDKVIRHTKDLGPNIFYGG